VKIVDKRAKGGKLYLKKGTVVDVKTPMGAPPPPPAGPHRSVLLLAPPLFEAQQQR
jgi:hypothetical protein